MRRQWSRFSADEEREAARLYADGKTVRELAEWFGRPTGSIHTMLRRLGVQFRPRGSAPKALP